jgi:peptide-methionine (S)-S-oxide reductase
MLPSGEESKLKSKTQKIGLGGGCHWCTEAVFQSLLGVEDVAQGFVASDENHSSFSEAVIVDFNPEMISLGTLIEIHLYTHKSTSAHSMRSKYRSAVYYFNEEQQETIDQILQQLQNHVKEKIITKALPFRNFQESEARFQNYYYSNPEKPFCETHINPKLSLLLKQFSNVVNKEKIKRKELLQ